MMRLRFRRVSAVAALPGARVERLPGCDMEQRADFELGGDSVLASVPPANRMMRR